MNNLSKYSNKYKKYAFRKIGKFFGSCAVATVITLSGAAIMTPNVTVYASVTTSEDGADIDNITSTSDGYEVFVPKGKKYERDDTVESHTPVLKEEGYNGRSFILKAKPNDNLTEKEIEDHFGEEGNELANLFEKLYDKDDDNQIDEKYKRADADTINENAGNPLDDPNFVEPKVSEVNPKYPHRLDSGIITPDKDDSNHDGKPDGANGEIDSDDTIVESNKPITVNPNSEENIVNDDGTVVLSKYYRIHVNEGEHADKKDDIYVVGTKPKVERTPIPFETTYKRDDSVPEGTEEEVTAGVNGEKVTTTTYELNVQTGEVTPNEPTSVTTDPVTRVVKRGTQPKVEKTPIPFETRYEGDDSVPEGTEEVVTAGVNGETVKTTTYELNPTTGEVTANEPTTTTTNPVTKVVKRGTQPKVEKTPIPFETRYERDDSVPEGTEEEVTAGVDGETVKTTTYEINADTGVVTANEPTSKTTDAVTRVVKRGTQPKVEKTPIPFETRYEEDNSIPEGEEREVTAGVNGETVKTTTYELNPTTGEVTANEPKTATTDPVTRVVKRGTQPKVQKTPENSQPEQPGEETPSGDKPTDKPTEGTPSGDKPTDKPTEGTPSGDKPTDKPTEGTPSGDKPTDKPTEGTPSGDKPTDKPTEGTPSGDKPTDKPTEGTPSGDKPTDKPTEGTPSGDKPTDKPTEGTPSGDKPTDKPTEGTPSGDKPTDKPTEGTPSGDKPTEGTPSSPESSTSHSTTPSSSSSTSTPEKPSKAETPAVRTVWRDENGKDLKVPSVDKQEAGEFEGYEFVESHREGDNVTVHVFRAKKTTTNTPNEKTTQPEEKQVAVATVTSDKKEEETLSSPTSERVELPNTGTVTNGFFTAEVAAILAGLGILIPGVKKKETEE